MEKEFVPYELAVKLKELGFDERCFGHYWENLFYFQTTHTHPSTMPNSPESCLVPLFQQAFRWFDENTELKGFVCPSIKEEHFDWLIRIDWEEEIECEEAYPSRQEAELACLEKLIEIIQGGKNE